jgi:hypothetical protein
VNAPSTGSPPETAHSPPAATLDRVNLLSDQG